MPKPASEPVDPKSVPALILAGGASHRMGNANKAFVTLGTHCLLDHVIARLAPQCGPIALSANDDEAAFAARGLPVLPDTVRDRAGPLAGILAGLDWAAAAGHTSLVTVAVDTPFFPLDLVDRLSATANERGRESGVYLAARRRADGTLSIQPTFGLWPVHLKEPLRRALAQGTRKLRLFADRHGAARDGAALAIFDEEAAGRDAFFNINTPEDLRMAEEMIAKDRN